jgi:hypothetical protein
MNRHRDRDRDRRREHRVAGTAMSARVRPGYHLIIIDLSACGALVEAWRPLRPGSHVEVQLETEAQRAMVAARVVRCAVAAIDAESGVTYRAALSFNETCDWVRELLTPGGYAIPADPESAPADGSAAGELLPAVTAGDLPVRERGAK